MIIIFLMALLVRLFVFLSMKGTIWHNIPIADAQFYDAWAQAIAAGDIIGRKVFFMNPGYPYLLALVYAVFGHKIHAVILIQLLTGTVNCALVYLIAQKIFNRKVAYIAGFLASFYALSIFYEGLLLTATFIVFFNLAATLFLLKAIEKTYAINYLFSGICIGISALLRPNVLVFVPFLLVWLIIRKEKLVQPAAGFLLGVFIMLAPVTLRNYLVSNQFVLTTASAGMNFYIGNNPDADGTYSPSSFENANPENQQESYRMQASRKLGRELDLKEASGYWAGQAFDFIVKRPASWLVLLGKKVILFFNSQELPTNINYYFVKKRSVFRQLPLLNFGMIIPLGLLGFALCLKQPAQNKDYPVILLLFVISYLAASLVFFVGSEYRYPVAPYVIIPGAYALYAICEKFFRKDYRKILLMAGFAGVIAVPANLNLYKIEEVTSHNNLGVIYLKLNRPDEALAEFREALKLDPGYIDTYNNMAGAYNQKGDYNGAVRLFRHAIQLDPHYTEAYNNLANTYFRKKLWDKSIELFNRAIKINPGYTNAYYGLGVAYYNKKQANVALRYFKKAAEMDPRFYEAYFEIGNIYTDMGMIDKAINYYSKAAESGSISAGAYNNLGALYFAKKMYKESASQFGNALKLRPDSVDIRSNYERAVSKLQDNSK